MGPSFASCRTRRVAKETFEQRQYKAWKSGHYPDPAFPDEMEVPYDDLMTTFADGLYTVIAKYRDYEDRVQSANL